MRDIMTADGMVTRDAMTSAAMVLTYVSGNIPVSPPERLHF